MISDVARSCLAKHGDAYYIGQISFVTKCNYTEE